MAQWTEDRTNYNKVEKNESRLFTFLRQNLFIFDFHVETGYKTQAEPLKVAP